MTHKPNWRDILLILAAAGLCVLLAGTIDDTMNDWKEIRVADGKEGWLQTKDIEVI